ncbi:ribbon-helix-helix protein, CopG family [Gluconobacter cerinus]|uniref:ribbon-helix-helix protein, CopG family n=1 Tax=Gluconobacter cerinus TaxID=38307 RepID=UPI001B8D171B|nr:ribbon-helix-helix protein, CopG family [Gluconobacter cerinus]MBS1038094.1 ribbon-helix-helix protein, CopG family [Gluconobacter cerinus]
MIEINEIQEEQIVKPEKTVPVKLTLKKSTKETLTYLAKARGTSMSQVIEDTIELLINPVPMLIQTRKLAHQLSKDCQQTNDKISLIADFLIETHKEEADLED